MTTEKTARVTVVEGDQDRHCTQFDLEQILRVLFHHMDHNTRNLLLREVPASYQRYIERIYP